MNNRLMIAVAVFLAGQNAYGQIVECIDAKGAKTLAQFCPPGTVKEIKRGGANPTAGGAPAAGAPAKSLAEQDAAFKKRTLERQEAEAKGEKEKAESKNSERNCNEARAQLKQLQEGMRISKIDPATGERNFLDDKDRPAETANAQKSVDSWCKK
jgi:hypothetical protein